jgi:hypothetical protein
MPPKLLVAVLFNCCLFAQTDWRHADPNCDLVGGLNWRSLQASPVGPALKDLISRNRVAASLAATIDQVDAVTWSSTAMERDGRTSAEWVVSLTGSFDLEALTLRLTDLGYEAEGYRAVALLAPARPSSKRVHFALLDAHTVLAADAEPLRRAVDRFFDSPAWNNPLFAQAAALAQNYELWAAGSGSPLRFYRKKLPDTVAGLPAIQAYTTGLSLRDSPILRLSLTGSDSNAAEVFASMMRVAPYLVKMRDAERETVQEIWNNAEFTQDAETARAALPLQLLLRAVVP